MELKIDIQTLVDSMIDNLTDCPTNADKEKALQNYWSIILLDNLPDLETEVSKELKQRGYRI